MHGKGALRLPRVSTSEFIVAGALILAVVVDSASESSNMSYTRRRDHRSLRFRRVPRRARHIGSIITASIEFFHHSATFNASIIYLLLCNLLWVGNYWSVFSSISTVDLASSRLLSDTTPGFNCVTGRMILFQPLMTKNLSSNASGGSPCVM